MRNKAITFNKTKAARRLWNILKTAIALLLLYYVFSKTSWNDLVGLTNKISVPWLISALLLFYGMTFLITYRYWHLISRKITYGETLTLVMVQTVIGNMVAQSVGAATYAVGLRAKHNQSLLRGLGSLILSRIMDLLFLLVPLSFSAFILQEQIREIRLLIIALIMVILFVILGLGFSFIFRERFLIALDFVFRKMRLEKLSIVQSNLIRLEELIKFNFSDVKKRFGPLVSYTVIIFVTNYFFSLSSYRTFSLNLSLWIILFILSVSHLLSYFPISVLGGIGIVEVSRMYLLGLFGISQSEAAGVVIGLRILFLLCNLILIVHILLNTWLRNNVIPSARLKHESGGKDEFL